MRVLVTGSKGFIAKHLIRALLKRNDIKILAGFSRRGITQPHWISPSLFEYLDWSVDLNSEGHVKKALHLLQPDLIFHLAGNPTVKVNENDPFKIWNDNVLQTHKLLEYCKEGTKFVFASTILVYGDMDGCVSELSTNLNPTSTYGLTKLASEKLIALYHQQGKVMGRNLRLVANVGWGNNKGIVTDFINKLQSDSDYLEVFGDKPGAIKPFVHVSDTVNAMMLAGFDYTPNSLLTANVCSANEISVETVAECVMEASGIRKPITWLGSGATWVGDNKFLSAHSDKMHYLGWKRQYDDSESAVKQAVKDMICKY